MRVASFQWPVFKPYGTSTLEIYFQGCSRRSCTGKCHNEEIRSSHGGMPYTIKDLFKKIDERLGMVDCICFTGGEPLQQPFSELIELSTKLKERGLKLWLFTGEQYLSKIPKWCFDKFDVIKYGPYLEGFKQEGFPASSNQMVIVKGKDY